MPRFISHIDIGSWSLCIAICFCMACLPVFNASAQFLHFSHAFNSHLTLNPANTGRFNGDWRAVTTFRNQGKSLANDYQSAFAAVEFPLFWKEQRLDLGAFIAHDNSAASSFPASTAMISLAHGIQIQRAWHFHLGLQAGYVIKQLSNSNLSFPDQYSRDLGRFDPNASTQENLLHWSTHYPDIAWGAVLVYHQPQWLLSGGYATHHLNRPTESFFDQSFQLPFRHVAHLKLDADISPNLFIIASSVWSKQSTAQQIISGAHIGFPFGTWSRQKNSMLVGLHFRNFLWPDQRSAIFSTGLNWQAWSFLVAYDMDFAYKRADAIFSSAMELSIAFKMPYRQLSHLSIPCERY